MDASAAQEQRTADTKEPGILALLNGNPLSPEEARYWVDDEKRGELLHAYNVEVTEVGGATETVPVLASDSVDAIERAFAILFPDWDTKKPTSGMKIKVIAFDKRAR